MGLTSVDIGSSDAHEYSASWPVVNRTPGLGCHILERHNYILKFFLWRVDAKRILVDGFIGLFVPIF